MNEAPIHLLALPRPAHHLAPLPPGVAALHIERRIGKHSLRATDVLDTAGDRATPKIVPRAWRRLSGKGFIPGHYGWPKARFDAGFLDWTIYGHSEPHRDTRSDHFVITQDFIAHGQRDLDDVPVIRHIATCRYGTPLYRMNPYLRILPIYLKRPAVPPTSAHGRMAQIGEFGPQLAIIRSLLDLPRETMSELTWLDPEHYTS